PARGLCRPDPAYRSPDRRRSGAVLRGERAATPKDAAWAFILATGACPLGLARCRCRAAGQRGGADHHSLERAPADHRSFHGPAVRTADRREWLPPAMSKFFKALEQADRDRPLQQRSVSEPPATVSPPAPEPATVERTNIPVPPADSADGVDDHLVSLVAPA